MLDPAGIRRSEPGPTSFGASPTWPIAVPAVISSFYHRDVNTLVAWIEAIGSERSTLGSDLGQMSSPLPTDSFRKIVAKLLDRGLGEDGVKRMVRDSPGRLPA